MKSAELIQLQEHLGLTLKIMEIDWNDYKRSYGFTYDNEEDEAADRRYFNWHHFRGVHDPQSCMLDEEGHVRGIILRATVSGVSLSLPKLPALEYVCVCDNKQLEEINLAASYPLLQHLDLSRNGLVTFALEADLPMLTNLNLLGNKLKRFQVSHLMPALKELNLSQNAIKNWSIANMDKLPAVEFLYMNDNPLNESLGAYWKKEDGGNYARCLKELRESFGDDPGIENKEYKILVIGDGKAGKSCMVHRLVDDVFVSTWDSTHGISIRQYNPEDEKRWQFDHILNLWDFGGQDIYHATHRLFMQRNTIYLLLWNKDTESNSHVVQETKKKTHHWENKKIAYWLAYAQHLGGKSPVVVAQTHSSPLNRKPAHPEENSLKGAYENELPYLSDFLDIDASINNAKDSGYKQLMRSLVDAIENLDREEFLPSHWLSIREQLEEMIPQDQADSVRDFMDIEDNTLDYAVYEQMAIAAGEKNPASLLENWLVQTGVVFYKKGLFDDKIILNQAWAIRAVYALYDRSEDGYYNEIKDHKGKFDGKLLSQCWHKYGEKERAWFLDFMLKAELCFEIGEAHDTPWEERTFVAIEMLDPKRSTSIVVQEKNWEDQEVYELRYRYPFLHTGIIQRFIARTYRFASTVDDIYKNGLLVSIDKHFVIIEAIADAIGLGGQILVRAEKNGIMSLMRVLKEFENLHEGKEVDQAVRPANGEWVDWKVLQSKRSEKSMPTSDGKGVVDIVGYLPFLPVDEAKIEGLSVEEVRLVKNPQIPESDNKIPRVYFSYAWGDDETPAGKLRAEAADALYQELKTMEARDELKIMIDREQMTYKSSIRKFTREYGDTSVLIVLIISEKYLKSEYCMGEVVEVLSNRDYRERIFPVVLPDVPLKNVEELIDYHIFWEERKSRISTKIDQIKDKSKAVSFIEKLEDIDKILSIFANFTTEMGDLLTVQPSNYEPLVNALRKKIRKSAIYEL